MVNRQAKRLVGQKSFRLKVFVNIQTHAHIELTALYAPLPFHRSGLFTDTYKHIRFFYFLVFFCFPLFSCCFRAVG